MATLFMEKNNISINIYEIMNDFEDVFDLILRATGWIEYDFPL